jgi:hypothetical protein
MSRFLVNLASRSLGDLDVVRPRVPSLFQTYRPESHMPAAGPDEFEPEDSVGQPPRTRPKNPSQPEITARTDRQVTPAPPPPAHENSTESTLRPDFAERLTREAAPSMSPPIFQPNITSPGAENPTTNPLPRERADEASPEGPRQSPTLGLQPMTPAPPPPAGQPAPVSPKRPAPQIETVERIVEGPVTPPLAPEVPSSLHDSPAARAAARATRRNATVRVPTADRPDAKRTGIASVDGSVGQQPRSSGEYSEPPTAPPGAVPQKLGATAGTEVRHSGSIPAESSDGAEPTVPRVVNRDERSLAEDQRRPLLVPEPPTASPIAPRSPNVAEEVQATPTIRVSIGRVEVRAVLPEPRERRTPAARPRPTVSLDDYLKRDRGRT